MKLMDKREVLMLTTDPSHDTELMNSGARNRNGENKQKPDCVIVYNKAKKGVNFSDQMASY